MPSGPSNNESLQTYHAASAAFFVQEWFEHLLLHSIPQNDPNYSHIHLSQSGGQPWIVELIQWMACPNDPTLVLQCIASFKLFSMSPVPAKHAMHSQQALHGYAMLRQAHPALNFDSKRSTVLLCGPRIPKRMIETWDTEVTAHQSTVRVLYSIYERGFKSSKRISAIICFILLSLRLPAGLGPCGT